MGAPVPYLCKQTDTQYLTLYKEVSSDSIGSVYQKSMKSVTLHHCFGQRTGESRSACRDRSLRPTILALVCLLMILAGPVWALDSVDTPRVSQTAPTSPVASPEVSLSLPSDRLSLKVGYLPSQEEKDVALKLQALAARPLWMDFAPEPVTTASQSVAIRGKGMLQLDYTAISALRFALTYENDLRYDGGRDKTGFSAEYKPSDRLRMALNFGYEGAFTELASKGGKEVGSKTTYAYQLNYSPSNMTKFHALWKSLQTDGTHGAQGTTTQTSDIGVEQKFTGGLLRLGQAMSLTSSGGVDKRTTTSTLHLEWAPTKPFSMVADYSNTDRTEGKLIISTVAAKYAVSPRLNLAFNLREQTATNQDDLIRTDVAMDADLGSTAVPFKLAAKMTDVSQGDTPVSAREMSFSTGVGKPPAVLKISGAYRTQEGALDGKPAGDANNLKVEAQLSQLQVSTATQSFTPPKGETQTNEQSELKVALSPTTQAAWTSQRQQGPVDQSRETLALSQRLGSMEVSAGHEARDTPTGDLEWDTMRVLIKDGNKLPVWAQSMDGTGLFDTPKYGYRTTPAWGVTQPGLEIGWRKRNGDATADADSLRLVYRGVIGFLHVRVVQETNPWVQKGLNEELLLGERSFTELGVPLFSKKHAAIARFSQAESTGQRGRETFLALRSMLSSTDRIEAFVANETGWQFQGNTADPSAPTYGLAYSRIVNAQSSLSLKASLNPPVVPNQPEADRWRLDIAFSSPF